MITICLADNDKKRKDRVNIMIRKIKNTVTTIFKDEKGGPGLEEAVLLVFVGLVVANAADELGDTIDSSFKSAMDALKAQLGIS